MAAAQPIRHDEPLGEAARAFAQAAAPVLAAGRASAIDEADLADVIAAAVRLYAARAEAAGAPILPVPRDALTATETVTVVTGLLRAADLNVFDLAMWFRRAT